MARSLEYKKASPRESVARPHFPLVILVVVLAIANLCAKTPSCGIYPPQENALVGSSPPETSHNHRASESEVEHAIVHNTSIYRFQSSSNVTSPHDTISRLLPDKLYLIYGLESSGTTFIAKSVCAALGIPPFLNPDTAESRDKRIHIQHISLPLGAGVAEPWNLDKRATTPLPVVPVYYPTGCRVPSFKEAPPGLRMTPPDCDDFMDAKIMPPPHRYFVNITSHVEWYRNMGVEVFPILVIRDPSFHFKGVLKQHCKNEQGALVQYEQGRELMLESMDTIQPIIVSYEAMMTLKTPYLKDLYNKLNLDTQYTPIVRDGNLKYAPSDTPKLIHEFMKSENSLDASRQRGSGNLPGNWSRSHTQKRHKVGFVDTPGTLPRATVKKRADILNEKLAQAEADQRGSPNDEWKIRHNRISGAAADDADMMDERLKKVYAKRQEGQTKTTTNIADEEVIPTRSVPERTSTAATPATDAELEMLRLQQLHEGRLERKRIKQEQLMQQSN
jgi:hypothetical protein